MLSIIATTNNEDLYFEGVGFVEQSFKATSIEDAQRQMEEMGYYDPADFTFIVVGTYIPSPTTWRDYHDHTIYAK